jgi:hypothetical protein
MVIQCSDLFKNLNYYSINNTTGYPAELSGARIGKVLDAVTWPSTDRDLDAGQNTMASTGPISLENSLEHTYNVSMAEQGLFLIAPNGYATFQDRLHRSTATSEGTFGELPDLGITNYNFAMEDLYIYNDVRMTRDGGTEQVATDTTSQGVYGVRSYAQTGLINNTDDETQDIAYHLLDNWKTPAMRLKDITILPSAAPTTLYPQVLGRDISDKITVKLSQASINQDYFIEGIEHNWDAREPQMWTTKWQLSNASIWKWPERAAEYLIPDGTGDNTGLLCTLTTGNYLAVQTASSGNYVWKASYISAFHRVVIDSVTTDTYITPSLVAPPGSYITTDIPVSGLTSTSINGMQVGAGIDTGISTYYDLYSFGNLTSSGKLLSAKVVSHCWTNVGNFFCDEMKINVTQYVNWT